MLLQQGVCLGVAAERCVFGCSCSRECGWVCVWVELQQGAVWVELWGGAVLTGAPSVRTGQRLEATDPTFELVSLVSLLLDSVKRETVTTHSS